MIVASYDPVHGWSAPEIKPYGPLSIDPASSCLQYATNVFEGMKVSLMLSFVYIQDVRFLSLLFHPAPPWLYLVRIVRKR